MSPLCVIWLLVWENICVPVCEYADPISMCPLNSMPHELIPPFHMHFRQFVSYNKASCCYYRFWREYQPSLHLCALHWQHWLGTATRRLTREWGPCSRATHTKKNNEAGSRRKQRKNQQREKRSSSGVRLFGISCACVWHQHQSHTHRETDIEQRDRHLHHHQQYAKNKNKNKMWELHWNHFTRELCLPPI